MLTATAVVIAIFLAMLLDSGQAYWSVLTISMLFLPGVGMTWARRTQSSVGGTSARSSTLAPMG